MIGCRLMFAYDNIWKNGNLCCAPPPPSPFALFICPWIESIWVIFIDERERERDREREREGKRDDRDSQAERQREVKRSNMLLLLSNTIRFYFLWHISFGKRPNVDLLCLLQLRHISHIHAHVNIHMLS